MNDIKLGVNIDHVATLRNARKQGDPSLVEAAIEAQNGGANSLTMHLREDRRHIVDKDLFEVKDHCKIPINMEMALTDEMIAIATRLKPGSVCIVPEKREELTTEGGLNLTPLKNTLPKAIEKLKRENIDIYLFIEPDKNTIKQAALFGVDGVEIHTGNYALNWLQPKPQAAEMEKITEAAAICQEQNLHFHAGHGLNYQNIEPVLKIENLKEVNIGHSIISRALVTGLFNAVQEMKNIINMSGRTG